MNVEKICVMGLGYIGLPTAAIFASRKKQVIGVDINQRTVDIINRGAVHIVEPELELLVHGVITQGYLRATTTVEPAEAFLIAVPTPFTGNHEPDLSYIRAAIEALAPVLKKHDLVVLESTSPVGTTERMAQWLARARPDLTFPATHGQTSDIRVAHCPERVLPGHVLRELVSNDRIIGGLTPACSAAATQLYRTFVKGQCIETDARTAEMCKLTENSFRDVNIAFANELSMICAQLKINPWELIRLANHHPRVNILQPGPGVGGHCIAVDPWFIVSKSPDLARLIRTAREVNEHKPQWVIQQVKLALASLLLKRTDLQAGSVRIACYGLAFKADIDDLRESPALSIARQLGQELGVKLLLVEPNIEALPADMAMHSLTDTVDALERAQIHVLLVRHREFVSMPALRDGLLVIDAAGVLAA
ncbi:UDP-N-acetyl-D-mannosamine dehydrogenase [Pseudomonas sp. WS 5059]|uniref:UDP-N-acetyl-D-mannosamine dehydrogenase n=1 Tax=unclassified Pseudomonas TaxID=196821 RepID=UPI001473874C|nr:MULTISPECIES: UDP-N-acetyl-D-mannosamine dehydrogenase [unclassified Pseudomonas]NMX63013.1 UDP-N-acetyl-D-mannosamine dehydrogenase [Pseudomonas sp. WS 5079]NMY05911.1 UDP-N-acetyl-D-mannosamine dehydrogenase [Pseudomonas sp. WS 5059]NMY27232.1 UDP-N-acetyl-D-mannosamine dehydrogenase [Pseudomonas sp. WS 5021]